MKTWRVDADAFRMLYFDFDPEVEEPGDGEAAGQLFADGFGSEDDVLAAVSYFNPNGTSPPWSSMNSTASEMDVSRIESLCPP